MDRWGYNYLIEKKTLWEKDKLLVTSNFSFSHNVFKSCLLFMHQNEYLWSKGLKMAEMAEYVLDRVENIDGKVENAGNQHFLLFPQCFQKASFLETL